MPAGLQNKAPSILQPAILQTIPASHQAFRNKLQLTGNAEDKGHTHTHHKETLRVRRRDIPQDICLAIGKSQLKGAKMDDVHKTARDQRKTVAKCNA